MQVMRPKNGRNLTLMTHVQVNQDLLVPDCFSSSDHVEQSLCRTGFYRPDALPVTQPITRVLIFVFVEPILTCQTV